MIVLIAKLLASPSFTAFLGGGIGGLIAAIYNSWSATKRETIERRHQAKSEVYRDLLKYIVQLHGQNLMEKERLRDAYNVALVYAPDNVIRAINPYIDSWTESKGDQYTPDQRALLLRKAIIAIRSDALADVRQKSTLSEEEIIHIEIVNNQIQN